MPASRQCRIPVERAQILTSEHRDQPRELGLEAIDGLSLADARRLEIQWQGTRGDSKSDPTAMTSLEPRDLLRNKRRGPEGKQERCRRGPTGGVLCQNERGHLQWLRHVARKATVVLACHDSVKPVVEGETGLLAELADDGVGG